MNDTKFTLVPKRATKLKQWSSGWKAVERGSLWVVLLTAIATASSLIYPHPPLVSFATIAGVTLTPTKAVKTVAIAWLVNQIFGYTFRNYPQTTESFTWGLILGLGATIVTILATSRPHFSQALIWGHFLWIGVALVGGFIIFEGLIWLVGLLMGGEHSFTLAILGLRWIKEVIWTITLALGHGFLVARSPGLKV
ncbi:hypothetical protein [Microseira sp. BLCC-F43]|jgi:hypothetical protein|uniref:hypothetical protein n=1 Tax=Microseira sp. BLCC-F43 TaxID=3153602 RepID=UPI0035BA293A